MNTKESIHIFNGNNKTYVYSTSIEQSKALIILIHGLGEHVRRYDEQIKYFGDHMYSVLTADLVGHGRSEGKRGVWNDIEEHYKVIDGLFSLAKKENPSLPIILFGHSMGGNLAAGYVTSRKPNLTGLILTGSAIKTPKDMPLPILKTVINAPAFLKNIVISNGLNLKSLCNDASIIEKYIKDKLVHDRISLGAGAVILNNAITILSTPFSSPYPVLIMHGQKDTITFPSGSSALAAYWNGDITLKIMSGMLHEIHNEPDKKMVWDEMISWMNKI